MPLPPPDAVPIAIGGLVAASLATLASPVLVADDNLLLGPSRAAPARHRAARARFWRGAATSDFLDQLDLAAGPPLLVYLPPTPNGLLCLAQGCHAAVKHGRDVWVIDLGPKAPSARPHGLDPAPAVPIDLAPPQDGEAPQMPAAPWSRLPMMLLATLWRLWCRRSPSAFSRFCASAAALDPRMANLGRCHAGVFPRVSGRALRLSRFDELLLQQLSREWTTPAQIFADAIEKGSSLGDWASHTGDLHLAARLLAWSRHSRGRIVEQRRERAASATGMMGWSFRWCPQAEGILDALPSLDIAPPLAIGGAVAHDPARPWASRVDAKGEPYVSRVVL